MCTGFSRLLSGAKLTDPLSCDTGRRLQGNSGDAKVLAKQVGLNVALKSAKTNQLNAGQNSAAVGSESDSSNLVSVDQTNGAARPSVVLRCYVFSA